ncbi:hypothetical protein NPA08_02500 [Mycoplasmopsis citelli]|uniref:hypothetical protein n=1 Tax=Mycoplasmopsis citelli TaxID=171281 RepID=UPI00211474A6|nr:hypothetical protein [Mycoplasmopsis citelli]UUD35815.1 hypothetical protein NPA08_02500 [Mycoplasmopsis citelli]
MQILSENLNNLKTFSKDLNIQKLVQMQIENIQKNSKETQSDLLNSISQSTNLLTTVKNIESLITEIKDNISRNLNSKSLSSLGAERFLGQLDKIVETNFDNIQEYLQKLNTLNNNIYDNVLLGTVFKNSLKKLNHQILEALNKSLLSRMSSEVSSLLNDNASVKELNDALRIQSNNLREINRSELKNWYEYSKSILDENIEIDQKIKDKLQLLNSKAILLIPQNSTAIRQELQFLIEQYREEHKKANVSEGLQNTLKKYGETEEQLLNVFGSNAQKVINTPFV